MQHSVWQLQAFETNKYNGSQHVDRFRKQQEADEKLPSYREWQTTRLQQQPAVNGSANFGSDHTPSRPNRSQYQDRMQPQAMIDPGPVRYVSPSNRSNNPASQPHNPYSIATTDGKARYESRTHLQGSNSNTHHTHDNTRPVRAPWDSSSSTQNQGYSGRSAYAPSYGNHSDGTVPPEELRYALERVAASTPHSHYGTSVPPTHSADDTVV